MSTTLIKDHYIVLAYTYPTNGGGLTETAISEGLKWPKTKMREKKRRWGRRWPAKTWEERKLAKCEPSTECGTCLYRYGNPFNWINIPQYFEIKNIWCEASAQPYDLLCFPRCWAFRKCKKCLSQNLNEANASHVNLSKKRMMLKARKRCQRLSSKIVISY